MFKNVSGQKLIVFAFDSTTTLPKPGDAANLTAYVSKDYGVVTTLGDTTATEMDPVNSTGYYLFDLAQAETNGDTLLFSAKSSTPNVIVIAVPATVYTVSADTGGGTDWTSDQRSTILLAVNAVLAAGDTIVIDAIVPDDGGTISIIQGDSYYSEDGRGLTWSSTSNLNLAAAAITVYWYETINTTGNVITNSLVTASGAAGAWVLSADLSAIQTSTLTRSQHGWEMVAVLANGHTITLARGVTNVSA